MSTKHADFFVGGAIENSNFQIFESTLYMKSGSMRLKKGLKIAE